MATEALQTLGGASVPAFIKQDDNRGKDNIKSGEFRIPALKLCQDTTPERKKDKPEYIKGLEEGMLFNSASRTIYGVGPIHFIVIDYLGHRNTQFDPDNRKIVIEGNIPDDDPRCKFTEKIDDNGKKVRVKPIAVRFMDFLIHLVREGHKDEPMTLSFKSTQLGRGVDLNTWIKQFKGLASFAQLFEAKIVSTTKPKGTFYGWQLAQAGWVSESQYAAAEKTYIELNGKPIKVADEEAEDAAGGDGVQTDNERGEGAPLGDDDIPF